jgi:pimeloyl-ACP methyl ester carboxylesterase
MSTASIWALGNAMAARMARHPEPVHRSSIRLTDPGLAIQGLKHSSRGSAMKERGTMTRWSTVWEARAAMAATYLDRARSLYTAAVHQQHLQQTGRQRAHRRRDAGAVAAQHCHDLARAHGAWECTAAVRFKAPWATRSAMPEKPDYSKLARPTLLVTGEKDSLRDPGFGEALQKEIPGSRLHVIKGAGHCPHIEKPGEFNEVALRFLNA